MVYFTVKEAAEKMNISEETLLKWCEDGTIEAAVKQNGKWGITAEYVNSHKNRFSNKISAKEAAEKTKIPEERIIHWCEANRAESALKFNHTWFLSVGDAERYAKIYKEDFVKYGNSLVTGFRVFLALFLIFAGVFVAGILVMSYDNPKVGLIIAGLGALLALGSGALLKSNINTLKNNFKKQKEFSIESSLKKKIAATIVAFSVAVIIIPAVALSGYGIYDAQFVNNKADRLAEEPVDEEIFEKIAEFDEYYEEQGFITRIFYTKEDTVAKVKADAELILIDRAEEISAGISALEPQTKITSVEQYNGICDKLDSLKLSETDEFEKRVRERVENYDEFEKYSADFETLCNKYKVTKTCGSCRGRGRYSCSTCNGSGKCSVTWYEHGDWGEKSYSSYTCTKCNGVGRYSCRECGGDGTAVYYDFEK